MMREYQFKPATQMISVGEGDTINIEVSGRRVEYRYAVSTWLLSSVCLPEPVSMFTALALFVIWLVDWSVCKSVQKFIGKCLCEVFSSVH